jgi:nucleotide-binding universal stress UspA family protein
MYKNILIPTRGTINCGTAVADAIELAKALDAKVVGVHVTPKLTIHEILEIYHPQMLTGRTDAKKAQDSMAQVGELHKAAAEKVLLGIEELAKEAGVPYEGIHLDGQAPAEGIIKTAKEKGCDLIFMASHGTAGGLVGSMLGAVTSKVVAHSKIPVLVRNC